MSAGSVPIPFALETRVWWTGHDQHEERITCPDCLGCGKVTLVLASGEEHGLPCSCCDRGREGSVGWRKRLVYQRAPQEVLLVKVHVDGDDITYAGALNEWCKVADLFATREECQARCDALNVQLLAQDEERFEAIRLHGRTKYAWSSSYHRKQVVEAQHNLEWHTARLAGSLERDKQKRAAKKGAT